MIFFVEAAAAAVGVVEVEVEIAVVVLVETVVPEAAVAVVAAKMQNNHTTHILGYSPAHILVHTLHLPQQEVLDIRYKGYFDIAS